MADEQKPDPSYEAFVKMMGCIEGLATEDAAYAVIQVLAAFTTANACCLSHAKKYITAVSKDAKICAEDMWPEIEEAAAMEVEPETVTKETRTIN